jgi:hypothetical protein
MTMLGVLGVLAAYFAGVFLFGVAAKKREKKASGEQMDIAFPKNRGHDRGDREVALTAAAHR